MSGSGSPEHTMDNQLGYEFIVFRLPDNQREEDRLATPTVEPKADAHYGGDDGMALHDTSHKIPPGDFFLV